MHKFLELFGLNIYSSLDLDFSGAGLGHTLKHEWRLFLPIWVGLLMTQRALIKILLLRGMLDL